MPHVAIIGGTKGIGAGIAAVLREKGWALTITGVGSDEVKAYKSVHPDTRCNQLDVRDSDAVTSFFANFTELDGLVNCAGVLMREKEYEIETFEKVININLTGTMRCCLAAQPLLAQSGSAIVNMASMLSFFGGPLVPAYSASKGGVVQLTKALAGKWALDGIRVNAVAPGWIETEMTEALRADANRNGLILGRTPLERWGQPAEIGTLVAWLLSKEAEFVTGAVYPVDGGYSAM